MQMNVPPTLDEQIEYVSTQLDIAKRRDDNGHNPYLKGLRDILGAVKQHDIDCDISCEHMHRNGWCMLPKGSPPCAPCAKNWRIIKS
jgi:hypothetical protein